MARHIGELTFGFHAVPGYVQRFGMRRTRVLSGPHHLTVGFLRPRTGKVRRFQLQRGEETVDLQGRHAIAIDDGNAYLAAGLAGLGVVCLLEYMARA